MKLNAIERVVMNNPLRRAHQHHRESAWFRRLGGEAVRGGHVLEIGCGQGVGVEVLLERLHAGRVTAFDLDPSMIERARRRLHDREDVVELAVGDVSEIEQCDDSIDAAVDFGVIHHVPDWRTSLAEIARVLRPGGTLLFEEVPRHTLETAVFQTLTDHPRHDRFEPDEFADELTRHGLEPLAAPEPHFGGHLFVGAARKAR